MMLKTLTGCFPSLENLDELKSLEDLVTILIFFERFENFCKIICPNGSKSDSAEYEVIFIIIYQHFLKLVNSNEFKKNKKKLKEIISIENKKHILFPPNGKKNVVKNFLEKFKRKKLKKELGILIQKLSECLNSFIQNINGSIAKIKDILDSYKGEKNDILDFENYLISEFCVEKSMYRNFRNLFEDICSEEKIKNKRLKIENEIKEKKIEIMGKDIPEEKKNKKLALLDEKEARKKGKVEFLNLKESLMEAKEEIFNAFKDKILNLCGYCTKICRITKGFIDDKRV